MEVYKCLDNIITKVEKQEKIILKARLFHGTLVIIDLHKFKYNSRLEGAEVFKMLFGISEHNPFGNFEMETDENGYITILRELMISQRDWLLFNIFINTGAVPYYDAYLVDNKYLSTMISNLTITQEVCTKLGGIPSFDLFYDNVYKSNEVIQQNIVEPVEPKEDIRAKYQWTACCTQYQNEVNNFLHRLKLNDGWSLASIDLTSEVPIHYYYRDRVEEETISSSDDNSVNV